MHAAYLVLTCNRSDSISRTSEEERWRSGHQVGWRKGWMEMASVLSTFRVLHVDQGHDVGLELSVLLLLGLGGWRMSSQQWK
jgi:hypothetical protein